jgi:hypothetical protein
MSPADKHVLAPFVAAFLCSVAAIIIAFLGAAGVWVALGVESALIVIAVVLLVATLPLTIVGIVRAVRS